MRQLTRFIEVAVYCVLLVFACSMLVSCGSSTKNAQSNEQSISEATQGGEGRTTLQQMSEAQRKKAIEDATRDWIPIRSQPDSIGDSNSPIDYSYALLKNNDIEFTYDPKSKLTFDAIRPYYVLGPLMDRYPFKAIHETPEGFLYTVYSLQGGRLAYVFFLEPSSGINTFVMRVIEYPSNEANNLSLGLVLEKDLPQNILNRSKD